MVHQTSSSSLCHRPSCTLSTKIFVLFFVLLFYFYLFLFVLPCPPNWWTVSEALSPEHCWQIFNYVLQSSETVGLWPLILNRWIKPLEIGQIVQNVIRSNKLSETLSSLFFFPTADCCPLSANGSHCRQALETDAVAGEFLKYKRSKKL